MNRKFQVLIKSLKSAMQGILASSGQSWLDLKLNAEEVARRRRNRVERGEQNFLWCWQHRGFW